MYLRIYIYTDSFSQERLNILRHSSFHSMLHIVPYFAIASKVLFLSVFKRPTNPTAPLANTRSLEMNYIRLSEIHDSSHL